jgi:hypothetical protein
MADAMEAAKADVSRQGSDANLSMPAMGWIPIVYKDTDDLKRAGQRVVYLLNSHVGHLGIFVSASVAKLEHRAILDSLAEIAALPPGLYEMKIDNTTGDPDCRKGAYKVRFEERRVEDLRSPVDRPAFERVREFSQQLDTLYTATLSKWVQSVTNPYMATLMEWLHPMRVSRQMFSSSFNPAMPLLASLASGIRNERHAVPDDAPLKKAEAEMFDAARETLTRARVTRDDTLEQLFDSIYGSRAA